MTGYLVRLEGVNLERFVDDTPDLSTARGGGLALLAATGWFKAWARSELGIVLEEITSGASNAIFSFSHARGEEELAEDFRRFFREYQHAFESLPGGDGRRRSRRLDLRHATFVLDVIRASEGEEGFAADRGRLLALNRFQQMQAPSLSIPGKSAPEGHSACQLDRVRPAATGCPAPAEGRPTELLSESVYQRREYGRAEKQAFYERMTGESYPGFSPDLEQLTARPGHPLDGKMAVLHFDGNGFGALQDRVCRTPEAQREFDGRVRGYRRELLHELLVEARRKGADFREAGGAGAIRFETLLWGGDEVLWVVPAWRGWWTLDFFFRGSAEWTFAGEPLTHAAGLVFASHKAPIQRMRRLAADLAKEAKKDRTRDLFAYEVLESFDYVGKGLSDHRSSRTPPGEDLVLPGDCLRPAAEALERLRAALPHGKLIEAARAGIDAGSDAGRDRELAAGLTAAERSELEELRTTLGGGAAAWVHLAELWDYLVPVEEGS